MIYILYSLGHASPISISTHLLCFKHSCRSKIMPQARHARGQRCWKLCIHMTLHMKSTQKI
jgi:hypothetical protein